MVLLTISFVGSTKVPAWSAVQTREQRRGYQPLRCFFFVWATKYIGGFSKSQEAKTQGFVVHAVM
jgi:hypothetical protein